MRTEDRASAGRPASSMPATKPGLTARIVGCCDATSAAIPGGEDGSGLRIVVAPTANGNVIACPSP